jgi:hypothetical protein
MKNNNKIYIILSAFALAVLILILFFIYPLLKEIKKNSEDLISAKNRIASLAIQNKETESFEKNYATYKPDLEKIDQLFVDPNKPVDLIEFLESSVAGSGLTSQISLSPSSSGSKQKGQNFIIFQLISKGSFSGVLNLSKKVETGPYLIEIENLTIQNPQDGKVNATFTIKAFTKK